MRCVLCGAETSTSTATNVPLDVGIPGVYIAEATVYTCTNPDCGEDYTEFPPLEGMLSHITKEVVRLQKTSRLTGPEIRFLRKRLGWSREDFADHFCVDKTTVSKWENDAFLMEEFKEKMLCQLALRGPQLEDYSQDVSPEGPDMRPRIYVPDFKPTPPAGGADAKPQRKVGGRK